MKKLLLFALSFSILITIFIPITFAAETVSTTEISEMKDLVGQALSFGDTMRYYFPNVAIWIEDYNVKNPVDLPYYTDTQLQIGKFDYLLLYENLLPGGSYANLRNYAEGIFTADVAERATTKAYLDNSMDLFYTSDDGKIYIASPETLLTYYRFDDNVADTLQILEAGDNYAIGRICIDVCHLDENDTEYELFHSYPAWVECKFIKTDTGWRIADSAFADMLTSKHFDSVYCSEDDSSSPATADPAVNSFVILPVISLACLVPAVCLLRRRRRSVI